MKSEKKSNRSFGILFFIVFIIIGFWPILSGESIRIWSLIISVLFLFENEIASKSKKTFIRRGGLCIL